MFEHDGGAQIANTLSHLASELASAGVNRQGEKKVNAESGLLRSLRVCLVLDIGSQTAVDESLRPSGVVCIP